MEEEYEEYEECPNCWMGNMEKAIIELKSGGGWYTRLECDVCGFRPIVKRFTPEDYEELIKKLSQRKV